MLLAITYGQSAGFPYPFNVELRKIVRYTKFAANDAGFLRCV